MRRLIAAVTLILSAVLLFAGLNHYALWDDEAVTALAAEGVWKTGDTTVLLDHNIVAYRSGLLLKGTHERSTPPLGAYIAAPFIGILGPSSLAARLPFALLGLASVAMILWWLHAINAHWLTFLLVGMAIVGNVSFQLYIRQCRYYSPAIFSSIVVAYFYLNWNGSRRQLVLLAAAGLMLLSSNYLNYVALHLGMLLDYFIVGRKRRWLKWTDWLIVLGPQIVLGGIIVLIWNTLGTGNKEYLAANTLMQRLTLVWMNLRDINYCEYGAGIVILAAPVVYFTARNQWLLRGPLALVVYVIVVSFLSPQLLAGKPMDADVRYLAPLIPLCIAIEILVLIETSRIHIAVPISFGLLLFGSNILNGAWLFRDAIPFRIPIRSTIVTRIGELLDPPPEPYAPTAAWIRSNVKPRESIWVVNGSVVNLADNYMMYPLMFHAPEPIYAWQFAGPVPEALRGLPAINSQTSGAVPDYAIAFGPVAQDMINYFQSRGEKYGLVEHLNYFPRDAYRPELFWHSFAPQPSDWQRGTAVYIFKHLPRST